MGCVQGNLWIFVLSLGRIEPPCLGKGGGGQEGFLSKSSEEHAMSTQGPLECPVVF